MSEMFFRFQHDTSAKDQEFPYYSLALILMLNTIALAAANFHERANRKDDFPYFLVFVEAMRTRPQINLQFSSTF